jgi:sulfur dioxygenase
MYRSDSLRITLNIFVFSIKDQMNQGVNKPMLITDADIPLGEAERLTIEERAAGLHKEVEAKRLSIKNLKLSLDRLDITE